MKNSKVTRKPTKSNISLKRKGIIFLNRFIFFIKLWIVILIGLIIFTDYFKTYKDLARAEWNEFTAKYGFVLETIVIEGQKNAPSKDIIKSLNADKGAPIFSVEIQKVKEHLEDTTWVKKAIVERRLPSTIYIAIIERNPVAIWQFKGKLYLIDEEGNRISKYQDGEFPELIHVVGQDANIYIQGLLAEINTYPNLASKIKSAVRFGQRRWNLNLEEDILVKMPEDGFREAYEYLRLLHKDKKLFDQNYKMLDLRDKHKYYLEKT
jgi:cell division protein FtsQ